MLKRLKPIQALLLALVLSLTLTACSQEMASAIVDEVVDLAISEVTDALSEGDPALEEAPPFTEASDCEDAEISAPGEDCPNEGGGAPPETPPDNQEEAGTVIDEYGSYTSKEDVALYIHTYGHLPENFITKKEAEALGWSGGGLDDYAYGACIGGNRFGNYEGLLPEAEGRSYTECDIDTMHASKRGAKRIVFSNDGLIYYTEDHYESFTLLYGEE